jgi:hypothetical protein
VELPGIEPDGLPGNMPSELPVHSVSFRFSPARYLRIRFRVLTNVHDAMRWLGDIALFESPIWSLVLDRVILGARVASAAGDAGLRARVLHVTEVLEREHPAIPLFTGVVCARDTRT